ncbi:aconitate hydratase AcnA [Pleomorphochaeta sp. DL1XJH-081]|uniref:aconitate hydratase AcnA n=1 Tax=Pleomorphochaeta sp. DL1XJH-081 TaxID=3409690 RepID=UPI003BB7C357
MAKSYTSTIFIGGKTYRYIDISRFAGDRIDSVPYSLRILLENLMRHADKGIANEQLFNAIIERRADVEKPEEVPFHPERVLMQDFTGVPAVVDLASLRDAVKEAGKDPKIINPKVPVDLVVDHSVQIDSYGEEDSRSINVGLEYQRNHERYSLLKWAQKSFTNLRIVPPNSGICHQVNLEYLADCVRADGSMVFPDSLVGTDSHTTMINGLGVMGWGVGGIEAEAVMLGQPYFMPIPRVVGVRLTGAMDPVCTATDLVLTLTNRLRKIGVVGAFVEYFGPGLPSLDLPDRATIANMSPEYGATMGFFPVDERTIEYLRSTGRDAQAERTEIYCSTNALFHDPAKEAIYDQILELDLSSVVPSIAGPSRPQDRISLSEAAIEITKVTGIDGKKTVGIDIDGIPVDLPDGAIAIAAITSCTNTSNPSVMIAAGLLAKEAVLRGLQVAPWVKTSLAPGSQVVTDYLTGSGLLSFLETLGFHIAAFGCTTCIGNSGPLHPSIEKAQQEHNLTLASVLSGNRNFDGRIHKNVKASFLMSPPLVVAYALAGRMDIDLTKDPLGLDTEGNPVYLNDIWPKQEVANQLVGKYVTKESFIEKYRDVFTGDDRWARLEAPEGETFTWDTNSTYIARPPFFDGFPIEPPRIGDIVEGRALLAMGDSVTTDHISPAGSIDPSYPAGKYLIQKDVPSDQFNSYGSRRGNHEIMMRGTFANTRIKQKLSHPKEGGYTKKLPENVLMHVFDAAMAYMQEETDLLILAGKEYGTGSSRDWAAKGTSLLGIRAVIAESFERIHRSNLVGMGIMPLVFEEGETMQTLGLDGTERFSLAIPTEIVPKMPMVLRVEGDDGSKKNITLVCRLDSPIEIAYYRNGGILHYVLRSILYAQHIES